MIQPLTVTVAAVVLVISLVVRCLDALRFQAFGVDTFANLLYARKMKGGSLCLYKTGKIVYPPELPRLLKHLDGRVSVRAMHVIPKVFDVLTAVVVFIFTFWATESEVAAILALSLYSFSPINVINGYGIGTRSIGSFFFASTILLTYLSTFGGWTAYVAFVFSVLSSVLMMLVSRIAYKSYFILSVAMLFLAPFNMLSRALLLVSATSLATTLLITRGRFIDDFKGQVFLINFFRKRKSKGKSLIKRVVLVFYYDLSWLVGVLAAISGADVFLGAWLLVIAGLSFAWPWGEGERHIALGSVPASILAASYLHERYLLVAALILAVEAIVIARVSLKLLKGRYFVSVDKPLQSVFDTVRKIDEPTLILCLPPVYSAPVAYFVEKEVLYGESSSIEGVIFQGEILDELGTTEGLRRLVSQYGVTHVFVDTHATRIPLPEEYALMEQEDKFKLLKTSAK